MVDNTILLKAKTYYNYNNKNYSMDFMEKKEKYQTWKNDELQESSFKS